MADHGRRSPRPHTLMAALVLLGLATAGLARPGPATAQLPPGEIVTTAICCVVNGKGALIRVNPLTGAQSVLATDIVEPISVTLGPGDDLYVLTNFNEVIRVKPTGEKEPVGHATGVPQAIVTGVDGGLYILNFPVGNPQHRIHRMDPQSGAFTLFASDLPGGNDMAVTPNGDLIVVASCPGGQGCLIKVNPSGQQEVLVDEPPPAGFANVAVGPDGTIFFSQSSNCGPGGGGDDCVYRVDGSTSTFLTANEPFLGSVGRLAVASTGTLLVLADCAQPSLQGDCLIAVDPGTGTQTLVSFKDNGDLLDALNGDILVVPGTPGPQPPRVALQLNQSTFGPGDTLVLGATLTPGTDASPLDAYVVLELPGGALVSLTIQQTIIDGLAPIASNFVPLPFSGELFRTP